ncbi:MAG TPA: hypothetical protein VNT42_03810 [Sphingomonas sp.]|nr:hypothetical protein [Sphingomonas sp.]
MIVIDAETRAANFAGRQDGKPMYLKTAAGVIVSSRGSLIAF